MARYAAKTDASSARTRDEIERTLIRYGATSFAYGWEAQRAVIMFDLSNRRIRFTLPMPDPDDREFTHTEARGARRSREAQANLYDQATRACWRALLLVIKAKLEAVASGIVTQEDEFLAYTVLPDGSTVAEWAHPQLEAVYASGQMPPMLPGSDAKALPRGSS